MDRYFIKYAKEEVFADDLLFGKFYMNAAAYYWNLENDQGDIRESTISKTHRIYMNSSCPIFCLYHTDTSDIQENRIKLKQKCIKEFSCQTGWVVVIKEKELMSKIPFINFNGFFAKYGDVTYQNLDDSDMKRFLSEENLLGNLFYKHPRYAYQNEFRITCFEYLKKNIHHGIVQSDGTVVDQFDNKKPYWPKTYCLNGGLFDIAKKYYIPSIASDGIIAF